MNFETSLFKSYLQGQISERLILIPAQYNVLKKRFYTFSQLAFQFYTHLTCIGSDFCPTATCKPKAGLVCSLALCLLKGASGQEGGSPGNPQGQRGSMLRRKEKVCGNNFGAHGFPLLFSVPWKQGYLHLFFSPKCSLLRFSPFSLHCHLCLLFFSRLSSSPPLVLAVLYCIWNAPPPFPTVFAPFFSFFWKLALVAKVGAGGISRRVPRKCGRRAKWKVSHFLPFSW